MGRQEVSVFAEKVSGELTLTDIIRIPRGQRALEPWAMGQCLKGHPAFP
jgi:hypothetical protein